MLKKVVISIVVLIAIFTLAFFTPPFAHIRNFVSWGKHTIFDYRTHPTRLVENGNNPQFWPLDSNYNQIQIPDSLLNTIDTNNTHAFLVIQNGKLLFEKYWDGYTKDSISGSFSAAKSLISNIIYKSY